METKGIDPLFPELAWCNINLHSVLKSRFLLRIILCWLTHKVQNIFMLFFITYKSLIHSDNPTRCIFILGLLGPSPTAVPCSKSFIFLQDLREQGDLGSELGSGSCSDFHWNSAAGWGSALKCLLSFPSGNVWEKPGKSALISQLTGVTLNLSFHHPSFCIHFLNKGIVIKLDTPLFKGGSFNEWCLSSAGL